MNTPALTLSTPRRYQPLMAETTLKTFLPTQVRPVDTRKMLVHEIRNPLANINLATELLKDMANDEEQRRYLDIIARNSARITALVADLLTHPNANHLRLEKHSIHRLLEVNAQNGEFARMWAEVASESAKPAPTSWRPS